MDDEINVDDLDDKLRLQILWQTLRGFATPNESLSAIGSMFFQLWESSSLSHDYTFEQYLKMFSELSADVYLKDKMEQQKEKENASTKLQEH